VAKKSPGDVAILKLIDRDLSGEGTIGLVEDILGCYLETGLEVLASKEEIERWWSNDNLCYKLTLLADIP
jgi:hypothetical protein